MGPLRATEDSLAMRPSLHGGALFRISRMRDSRYRPFFPASCVAQRAVLSSRVVDERGRRPALLGKLSGQNPRPCCQPEGKVRYPCRSLSSRRWTHRQNHWRERRSVISWRPFLCNARSKHGDSRRRGCRQADPRRRRGVGSSRRWTTRTRRLSRVEPRAAWTSTRTIGACMAPVAVAAIRGTL